MEEVKQVIVMRKDLHCRAGKTAAQVAHASMKALLDKMFKYRDVAIENRHSYILDIVDDSPLDKWLSGLFTKIVVYVNSEEELLDLYNKVKEDTWMLHALIQDAGKTEFNGKPTYTCLAIGPDWAEKIDEITGNLPLL